MILKDVKIRELEEGEIFVTRLTNLHGMVQQKVREWVADGDGEKCLKHVDVELMGPDGILRRKLIHPDVRVDLVNRVVH